MKEPRPKNQPPSMKEATPSVLSRDLREKLAGFPLTKDNRRQLGLILQVPAYAQDPDVALANPQLGIISLDVDWQPGIADGPTSARVAVVDYDADEGKVHDPVLWNEKTLRFEYPKGHALDLETADGKDRQTRLQFHQLGVWAIVEHILALYQDRSALGRPVPWGFEGNRLIVVPHAGRDENAYYDRSTKSIQLYYFDSPKDRIYACESHDIVAHETGHAVLDGIRPLYQEVTSAETEAFHEFVADLTQLLSIMRINSIRDEIRKTAGGKQLDSVPFLCKLGEQFAKGLYGEHDSIRDLRETITLDHIEQDASPHRLSQVLTNALFEITLHREEHYRQVRGKIGKQPLWYTTERLIQIALQPLDCCPPVDIQFADYVAALLCRDQMLDPLDEHKYRSQMLEILEKRGLMRSSRIEQTQALVRRLSDNLHDANFYTLSTSHVAAYHFLHKHRAALGIPSNEDLIVLDPYISSKSNRDASSLPRELVIQYVWREPVELTGKQFGCFNGRRVSLLCGGTLVFNENARLLHASLKPGTQPILRHDEYSREGERRRQKLLEYITTLIEKDAIALADEMPFGRRGAGLRAVAHPDSMGLRLSAAPRLHPDSKREHWRSR